jgi:hypothetical protein
MCDSKIHNFNLIAYLLFQEQGLQKQYEDDVDFAHGIHKTAALAFIHPDNVIDAFTQLSIQLCDTFQTMSNYFEDNYIGRFRANRSHARTLFNVGFWNVRERTKKVIQLRPGTAVSVSVNVKIKICFLLIDNF